MKDILYLIVIHDPKIIDHFESIKKYEILKNYKYVLVGIHNQDYSNDKVIQCDRLEDNIEHFKNYLAYTGWWAIAKNCLHEIEFKYIFFLEYDTNIVNEDSLCEMEKNIIDGKYSISGIASLPTTVCFVDDNHILSKKLNYTQNNSTWMVTNNILFEKNILEEFIKSEELEYAFSVLQNGVGVGHDLERFTTLYCIKNNIPYNIVLPCCFDHVAMDSHSTQGRHHIYKTFIESL